MDDETRLALNRRRNASLVQCRVPLPLRLLLSRAARRRGISVSSLVRAILIEWDTSKKVVAPKARRG